MIKPVLKQFGGVTIYGYSAQTRNCDERDSETAKIPALWQTLFSSPFTPDQGIYGVYSDYQSDVNGLYKITVGVPINQALPEIEAVTIFPGKYLVFENTGPQPETVIKTWQQVWDYFSMNPAHQRNYQTDFEVYTGKEGVEIYIGVQ